MRARIIPALLLALAFTVAALAQDKTADLKFTVVKADNGKPIRNAGVVLHPVDDKGHQSNRGMELKTDSEGKASFDGAPYGKLRVQVLAPGFQTYGEDFDINQPSQEITVKLKRPQNQYSIYDDKPKDDKPKQ